MSTEAAIFSTTDTDADAAWAAAADRIERYLRAHRVASHRQVARLTADIVGIARARQRPGIEPVTLAMETMEECMAAWFASLLSETDASDAQRLTRGRMALAMGDVPSRWPQYFLRDGAVPAELIRVMREADLGRAPEIRFSNMAPRKPAGTETTGARSRWQLSYRWPFVRVVSGLMVVLSLIGVTLAAGR